ncbi:MAG: 50S ribosomal protein L19 [Candidatus Omnitrophica bacterium]|nr:50S ribosomal protein L19 [Candidatus Omnitrophota bacterium]
MKRLEEFTKKQLRKDLPQFNIGDTLKVYGKVLEAGKVRIHPFEGIVIAKKGKGISETFTLRKISYGEGVERIFPINSPNLERIELLHKGKVRRAKLYYLRARKGKAAKVRSAG